MRPAGFLPVAEINNGDKWGCSFDMPDGECCERPIIYGCPSCYVGACSEHPATHDKGCAQTTTAALAPSLPEKQPHWLSRLPPPRPACTKTEGCINDPDHAGECADANGDTLPEKQPSEGSDLAALRSRAEKAEAALAAIESHRHQLCVMCSDRLRAALSPQPSSTDPAVQTKGE